MNIKQNKVCQFCRLEIDTKATKCPHCKSDVRNWASKHPVLTMLLIVFLVPTILSGIMSSSKPANNPTAITSTSEQVVTANPEVEIPLYTKLKELSDSKAFETPYNLTANQSCGEMVAAMTVNGPDMMTVKEGLKSASTTEKVLAAKLKNLAIARDVNQKPQARKLCAQKLKETMWEHDVAVEISGTRNTTLTFTGAVFASNKGIKAAQETIGSLYKNLGFKRVNYKWYEYDDTYTYFDIEGLPDGSMFK